MSLKSIHGVVTLKGTLPNQNAIDHAKSIAQSVESVKSVDMSDLTVAGK